LLENRGDASAEIGPVLQPRVLRWDIDGEYSAFECGEDRAHTGAVGDDVPDILQHGRGEFGGSLRAKRRRQTRFHATRNGWLGEDASRDHNQITIISAGLS
jgi:hypothetical protein